MCRVLVLKTDVGTALVDVMPAENPHLDVLLNYC
jgi:hypothetical protein